jgi:ABC-type amino acid transport system permease subunit
LARFLLLCGRGIAIFYVETVRIFRWWFLVLPLYGIPIGALTAGVLGLAINSTAFTIEIVRAGSAAIPPGQYEAARSLGLHRLQMLRLVIVPQVFRIILPTLGNQIVSVVLGSAQASIIGVGAQVISLLWRLLTGRAAHAPSAPERRCSPAAISPIICCSCSKDWRSPSN